MDEMTWISVEDRLPRDSGIVWIYENGYDIMLGRHYSGLWQTTDSFLNIVYLYNVTHWQPLDKPKPPA